MTWQLWAIVLGTSFALGLFLSHLFHGTAPHRPYDTYRRVIIWLWQERIAPVLLLLLAIALIYHSCTDRGFYNPEADEPCTVWYSC